MLVVEITLPAVAIIGAVTLSALAGYAVRNIRSRIQKNRILQLEQEVLDAHEQILDLHRKLAESAPATKATPVVPIKEKLSAETKHSSNPQQKKMP